MIILGIHDGHNCQATLCHDGKNSTSLSEERITRVENDVGFPKKAILRCIEAWNKKTDINYVAYNTIYAFFKSFKRSWFVVQIKFKWSNKDSKKQKNIKLFLNKEQKEEKIIKNLINIDDKKIFFLIIIFAICCLHIIFHHLTKGIKF